MIDLLVRLTNKIEVDPETGCWLWQGAMTPSGYARIKIDGETFYAHRVVYALVTGEIPEDQELDHLCRVRNCLNPQHLEPVVHRENILRGDTGPARNAVKTYCDHGHEFTEANTYRWRGRRDCRACKRERTQRWRS